MTISMIRGGGAARNIGKSWTLSQKNDGCYREGKGRSMIEIIIGENDENDGPPLTTSDILCYI